MRRFSGLAQTTPFVFVPHLLPVARGILTTLHVSFASPVQASTLSAAYEAAYADAAFVRVSATRLPELKDVVGTPGAEIGFVVLPGARQGVVVSVIDNLLKGAASQAVQNLNRVFGFPETEGLTWD
jgi:N-acetyl-gamma-glutamyl-phosphate reductase